LVSVQHVKPVPSVGGVDYVVGQCKPLEVVKDARRVRTGEHISADDDHRQLEVFEFGGDRVTALVDLLEHFRRAAEMLIVVGEVGATTNNINLGALAVSLENAGVQHGRFCARIYAYEQYRVGVLDALNSRVHKVAGAEGWVKLKAALRPELVVVGV